MILLKQIIALVFLTGSIWLGYLLFSNEFNKPVIVQDSIGTEYLLEDTVINTSTKLIKSTVFTGFGILFMGLLALFTNFVFTKLLFTDDIKHNAIKYLKKKRKIINDLTQKQKQKSNNIEESELGEEEQLYPELDKNEEVNVKQINS